MSSEDIYKIIENNEIELLTEKHVHENSFHYAIWHGLSDFVKAFIDFDPKLVDSEVKAYTALTRAICCNHYHIVKILLKNGADPNKKQIHHFSPLDISILRNQYNIAKLLLKKGAKPSSSSLSLAAMIDAVDICKLLLKNGADKSKSIFSNVTPFDFANDPDILEILKN
jgi:ankyrin repeat protein